MRHGVEFARGGGGVADPVGGFRERRLGCAGGFEIGEVGRDDGEFAGVERAVLSIFPDDGEGLAPVALAREKPVAEFEVDRLFAETLGFEAADDLGFRRGGGKSVERAAVDGVAFAVETLQRFGVAHAAAAESEARFGRDDFADGQREFFRKLPVALVVRRHGHDRAGAVAGQDVVGNPDGDALAADGIDGERAGEDAGLVFRQLGAIEVALARGFLAVFLDGGRLLLTDDLINDGMLRCEDHVGRAVERIGACRENGDGFIHARGAVGDFEFHLRAFAAADPVSLVNLDALGPVESVEFVNQPLRVSRDAQHPLAHRATLDGMAADFALAVNDLLVREHRAEFGAPVHRRIAHVGEADAVGIVAFIRGDGLGALRRGVEPRVVELHENPLRPFEIAGIGRVHLALPVVAEADALELLLEIGDVRLGRRARVLAGLDGVLLRRQAERVPAHRVQHIEAAHFLVAPDDVRRRVALGMADVQPRAARVGEHVEHVVFRAARVEAGLAGIRRVKGLPFVPHALPAGLELVERKWSAALVAHGEKGADSALPRCEGQCGNRFHHRLDEARKRRRLRFVMLFGYHCAVPECSRAAPLTPRRPSAF